MTHNVAIRVALEGTEDATRRIQAFGDEGEKAIKKVHDATAPASGGLKLVNAASEEMHDKMRDLSSEVGTLGSFLMRLGPVGLGVALNGFVASMMLVVLADSVLAFVIAWAVSGPIFGFSDTRQLVITTSTTMA